MKPANDPNEDYESLVRQGYDRCVGSYEAARQGSAAPQLDLLEACLPDGAQVLDIGCGAGVPVTQRLAERFQVTGVDISVEQVKRARMNVPSAVFLHGDIMQVDFLPVSFDAVVSYYAIFHLPREEHPALLRKIHGWLKPGGYLLATLSSDPESSYTEDDFFGVRMYWSNLELQAYYRLLEEIGFILLETTVAGHGYGDHIDGDEEQHPLVFAKKKLETK